MEDIFDFCLARWMKYLHVTQLGLVSKLYDPFFSVFNKESVSCSFFLYLIIIIEVESVININIKV